MIGTLDGLIGGLAGRVGVERACRALGTAPRSFRHRQQARGGRARPRGLAACASTAEVVAVADERVATNEGEATTTDAIVPTIEATATATAPSAMAAGSFVPEELTAVAGASSVVLSVAAGVECASVAADHAVGAASIAAAIARSANLRSHPASLTASERHGILEILCSERFADLSPRQVFMTLLDEGTYHCSVRSMYRLLDDHGLSGERRRGAHQRPGA